jgi:hypothetical protein
MIVLLRSSDIHAPAADYSFAAVTHYQTQLILSVFGSTLPKMAGFCLWISTIRKRGRHHQPARHKQPTGSLLYFGTLLHSNLYPNFIHPSSGGETRDRRG